MTETLYWYDLETTGIDSILDRPLQFAGVRTDLDLNEIEPPQNFLGRPGTDVLPQPEALLVTGISLVEIGEKGISERAFTEKVLEQFNQSQSCIVGFNSLRLMTSSRDRCCIETFAIHMLVNGETVIHVGM